VYGRLTSSGGGQAVLEDAASSLPVVLSCRTQSGWQPGLICVTAFIIGLEEGTPCLLLHNWTLIQPAISPLKRSPESPVYRVLAKSCLLNWGGHTAYFLRLAALDFGEVVVVQLKDLTDFPFIRPFATALRFYGISSLIFEPDKQGEELLRRKVRHGGEAVMKLKEGADFRVEEQEEEGEERWDQLDDATVAAMREDEDLNIR